MEATALTPEDWLDLALVELKDCGYNALKAQPLAKKLNVTRGSFYHHFESLDDFHAAVIAHWSERSSRHLIQRAQDVDDPQQALDELLQKTLRSGEELERAVRSWSTVKASVAKAVDRVDQERIGVAEAILVNGGVPKSAAMARAKLLYWAAIGRLMLPFPANNLLSQSEISDLATLMLHDSK
ncbi:TetR/AcrR family transcriptional regulator [Sulfitobacter sp. M57]|uniref:TetR/AcrR family transcriptional regulator n=1 Tax=unclassified Sulfitobacter TaxID=196795 RepID=UPI0023E13A9B|nr:MULTISPECIES: TetR/AcrR family transcriptional regulator [unclassified Sulfitobacter]MDF3415452.1 TetR/AcrR family transcriptional regulator [Sulfitobacter sp. KE5]MDF3422933.1 TetR/AcrR family transcriptional regulator [Sulfitobacter sp. KE43]MDF3433998.1 TetR/AcrR family transcriptional regulator [Sulfitobacter sp. KE42]MDF3459969.1 TetR/AcrR family transcriptional regulator [Sulfitobacter sp. S74]MDF3463537.1 TetR/AcrR family transcriptional regulator [Sulfitobacter sp. Ks18]